MTIHKLWPDSLLTEYADDFWLLANLCLCQ